jgi:hypothetical protein
MIMLMIRTQRREPSSRRESMAADHVVEVGNDVNSDVLSETRMSPERTQLRQYKPGLVGPNPFEDLMGKPRKKHPEEDSIFANNPFIEGLFEWMDSPEGEKHLEIYDALSKLM